MLRIAYVSSLRQDISLQGLDAIEATATHNNQMLDVTSVLIIASGTAFQLLEGPKASVASLMYKISRDTRHRDISIILKETMGLRLFSEAPIKVFEQDSEARRDMQQLIYKKCSSAFNAQTSIDAKRLSLFFGDSASSASPPPLNRYESAQLSLISWPKPTNIELTPKMMRLCSLLINRPQPFEKLLKQNIYKDVDTLVMQLESLNQDSLLKITKKDQAPTPRASLFRTNKKAPSSSRFSAGLRGFISSVRKA